MMEEDTGTDFWLPSAYMYTSVHIHMVREETEREGGKERRGRGRGERKREGGKKGEVKERRGGQRDGGRGGGEKEMGERKSNLWCTYIEYCSAVNKVERTNSINLSSDLHMCHGNVYVPPTNNKLKITWIYLQKIILNLQKKYCIISLR